MRMDGKPQKIENGIIQNQVIRVPAIPSPVRLDRFLSTVNPEAPRRQLRSALQKSVLVNGRRLKKGDLLFGGEEIILSDSWRFSVLPNPELNLPVLYEDDYLIALDKPAHMPCQPLRGSDTNTAANFLAAHEPRCTRIGGRMEAGLVHRLDTQTSGLLLAAKDNLAYQKLRQQFSRGQVIKEYIGLCVGQISEDRTIDLPLTHSSSDRRKMVPARSQRRNTGKHWEAKTQVHVLKKYSGHTLLLLTMETGVTHQIRVHLASLGHPLVGERLYADPCGSLGLDRHFLHAHRLRLAHPNGSRPLKIASPLPEDLQQVLTRLSSVINEIP